MKRYAWFALTISAIAVTGALVLMPFFPEPAARHAVWISALLSVVVQLATFAIARRYAARTAATLGGAGVMAGWGFGALLRVAVLVAYGFLGPTLLGLPLGPALVSFALFVFLSTVLEPLFLSP